MTRELRALTSARGLAAWFVVLYHIRGSIAGLPDAALSVLGKGYLAVDFFFLLSGFVIWLRYAEPLRRERARAVPKFLQRRIARIWPLHAVLLAAALGLALLLRVTGRTSEQFPLAELPLHLALLQNWGFTHALAWNDPAWSISCELAAYLLFPLLALTIEWRRVPTPAVLAAIAALLVLLHSVFVAHHAPGLGHDIPRLGLIRCVLEFAAGTAIGALWLRWEGAPRRPALTAALTALAALFAWGAGTPETLAVPAAFAALLLALALTAGGRSNPLEGRLLHALGAISYATYLSHYLLWIAFKLAFVREAGAIGWPPIGLYLCLVLAASGALHRWIERPAQRRINRLRFAFSPARPKAPPAPRG